MATYLVVHEPKPDKSDEELQARPPTRLLELARNHSEEGADLRWLKTWSPDLHDERLFSLWEAIDADAILKAVETYGFLDDFTAHPLRVQEWGPGGVLAQEE